MRAPNNSASAVRLAKKSYGVVAIGRMPKVRPVAAEIVIFRACSRVCYGEREREGEGGREERYCKLKQWRVESTCSR